MKTQHKRYRFGEIVWWKWNKVHETSAGVIIGTEKLIKTEDYHVTIWQYDKYLLLSPWNYNYHAHTLRFSAIIGPHYMLMLLSKKFISKYWTNKKTGKICEKTLNFDELMGRLMIFMLTRHKIAWSRDRLVNIIFSRLVNKRFYSVLSLNLMELYSTVQHHFEHRRNDLSIHSILNEQILKFVSANLIVQMN